MPSPFPGMDPFLEHPAVFSDLHNGLIVCLQQELQPRLPRNYYAATGLRVWVEPSGRPIGPDVELLRSEQEKNGAQGPGEAAVSEGGATPVVVRVTPVEHRETFLDVFVQEGGKDRLVTAIEVLSPSNKSRGRHGRKLYLHKQRELLKSQTHLLEIDLLRGGRHATAVPHDLAVAQAGPFDYHVCAHEFDKAEAFLVYPIRLQERLPVVNVPLLTGAPPVRLDLQSALDRAYDTGAYQRRIRYADRTPEPPLRSDQAEWVANLLREKGILPPT